MHMQKQRRGCTDMITKEKLELQAEIRKRVFIFEQRIARAWQLDGEDEMTDRDRKATREAHILADKARQELFEAIEKLGSM